MPRTVFEKMGLQEGTRSILVNVPETARAEIDPSRLDVAPKVTGMFGYIHLFVRNRAQLEDAFPTLRDHLEPGGMLWVSWPKNRQLGTDLTLPKIIEIGYGYGLVESKCLSVNTTWSALKFTHSREGKAYDNSYGRLLPP